MAELNLQQLRSANECNKVDESHQNNEDDKNNTAVSVDKCLNKENATLKEETEVQQEAPPAASDSEKSSLEVECQEQERAASTPMPAGTGGSSSSSSVARLPQSSGLRS